MPNLYLSYCHPTANELPPTVIDFLRRSLLKSKISDTLFSQKVFTGGALKQYPCTVLIIADLLFNTSTLYFYNTLNTVNILTS